MDDPKETLRRSIRLKEYDYSQPGAYFVTICTHRRECLLGKFGEGKIHLSTAGLAVQSIWEKLPQRYCHTGIDIYRVMPNHFHGIIVIEPVGVTRDGATLRSSSSGGKRPNGPIPDSLGAMIGQFKSRSTKRIWALPEVDRRPIWQRNYYDHIIRDEQEFQNIWDYIDTNPQRWLEDQLQPTAEAHLFEQD